jgi:transposase
MRFYTQQHPCYGGIDLHARSLYLCLLHQAGEIRAHRNMQAAPDPCLNAMAPYRAALVVCVEGLFTWSWLADLCARDGLPFVLGHARSMKAIHGGTANNETIDAHTMAVLRRGGLRPHADVYPAEMRATRDLLRRRRHLMHKRAERWAHSHNTPRQYHLPASGTKLASNATRQGVAERFPAPAVQKSSAVDLRRIDHDDQRLRDRALCLRKTAKPPDSNTRSLRRTSPGIGAILSLVLLYAIPDLQRFPRVPVCVSSCRFVTCARASARKRDGTAGAKIGNAALNWAFSAAAVLFWRANPTGQQSLARVAKNHRHGQA